MTQLLHDSEHWLAFSPCVANNSNKALNAHVVAGPSHALQSDTVICPACYSLHTPTRGPLNRPATFFIDRLLVLAVRARNG